jgi:hypothetical protein
MTQPPQETNSPNRVGGIVVGVLCGAAIVGLVLTVVEDSLTPYTVALGLVTIVAGVIGLVPVLQRPKPTALKFWKRFDQRTRDLAASTVLNMVLQAIFIGTGIVAVVAALMLEN